jgi:hypothetical protein
MLPEAWRRYALVAVVVGVISALYGALVALAQTNFKRMIAYTSVIHRGYILLAVGAAGLVAGTDAQARTVAVTGAVTRRSTLRERRPAIQPDDDVARHERRPGPSTAPPVDRTHGFRCGYPLM